MAIRKKAVKTVKKRLTRSKWIEKDVTPKRTPRVLEAERKALLSAVLETPEDDAPRLVYADWLLQRGDPRGELIVVQCEIARVTRLQPRSDPDDEDSYKKDREGIFGRTLKEKDHIRELRAREVELLKKNKAKWVGEFGGTRTAYGTAEHLWVKGSPTKWDFERGFVSGVRMKAQDFARNAEGIFEVEPLRSAQLTNRELSTLAACKAIGKLREPHLKTIELLYLWGNNGINKEGIAALRKRFGERLQWYGDE